MAKEKKKKRSDNEILKLTDKFYKELIADSPSKKSIDCRFRSKDGKRHCMATTNKTCSRCKFFEPTIMAKFEGLLRLLEDMRNENAGLRKKVSNRELEIVMLNAELAELEVKLKELKNEHDSDGVEPESVASGEKNDAGTVSEED
jgi:hypothetical protein